MFADLYERYACVDAHVCSDNRLAVREKGSGYKPAQPLSSFSNGGFRMVVFEWWFSRASFPDLFTCTTRDVASFPPHPSFFPSSHSPSFSSSIPSIPLASAFAVTDSFSINSRQSSKHSHKLHTMSSSSDKDKVEQAQLPAQQQVEPLLASSTSYTEPDVTCHRGLQPSALQAEIAAIGAEAEPANVTAAAEANNVDVRGTALHAYQTQTSVTGFEDRSVTSAQTTGAAWQYLEAPRESAPTEHDEHAPSTESSLETNAVSLRSQTTTNTPEETEVLRRRIESLEREVETLRNEILYRDLESAGDPSDEVKILQQQLERQKMETARWKNEAMGRGSAAVSLIWQASVDEGVRREREKDRVVVESLLAEIERLRK